MFFLFLDLDRVLRNSASEEFAYTWQIRWKRIIAMKIEKTRIQFLGDVFRCRCRPRILRSLGSWSNSDGDGYRNVSLQVCSRCLKVNRAYSISFNSSNVGKFFWTWILWDSIELQEKKKNCCRVFVFPKTWNKALSRRKRAVTAKKCAKNAWCTCRVVVLLI